MSAASCAVVGGVHPDAFIAQYLGECVYDTKGYISVTLGLLSTAVWIPAQFPQLWENYKNGNAQALAFIFLVQWLCGDVLNLTGCLLTHQLPTQTIQAFYFVSVDMILMTQYIYYHIKNRGQEDEDDLDNDDLYKQLRTVDAGDSSPHPLLQDVVHNPPVSPEQMRKQRELSGGGWRERYVTRRVGLQRQQQPTVSSWAPPYVVPRRKEKQLPVLIQKRPGRTVSPSINSEDMNESSRLLSHSAPGYASARSPWFVSMFSLAVVGVALVGWEAAAGRLAGGAGHVIAGSSGGRVLLAHTTKSAPTAVDIIGTVIAWSSACFYLGSRMPQIYQNYKRQSTDGLAIGLFICAVLGNSFYAASIFLYISGWPAYLQHLPYIIGSIGTLSFDFTIFSQFNYYRFKGTQVDDDDDGEGEADSLLGGSGVSSV